MFGWKVIKFSYKDGGDNMIRECIFCGTALEDKNKGYICKDCERKNEIAKATK